MNEMLSGIKVLDFGQYIAGPLAAQMLAEQGAEVIKIERPQGDPFRKEDGFMVWNRSKKNIVLDLTKPEGQKIALDLIKDADVIIENFRPGVMNKLGLSYEKLQAINPRIIYCSISGFGDSGPYTRIPGYEQLVSSLSTIYAEQGYATRPTHVLLPLASTAAGLDTAYSIVAALCVREGTGQGQKIEATLFNSALSINRDKALNFPGMYRINWLPTGIVPFYHIYKCADGKNLFLGLGNFKFVTMFVLLIGREDWLVGDLLEGATFGMLPPKAGRVIAWMKDIFLTKTRDEWLELLLPNGIPAAPVQTIDDYMEYEQVKANDVVITVRQPGKGMVREVGIPIKPSLTPGSIKGPSASPGQHTAEILNWLQLRRHKEAETRWESQNSQVHQKMMPFENIRVADFTTMLAGPGITRILADLGADVIKVETPEGDTWRPVYGPFIAFNRGKRGMAMDLTKPEARQIAHKLISTCHVLVENSRPGIMKKLGMDYETVKQIRPDIIYISSTAFGTKGPDSQRPGYDPLFQALSGQMAGQGGIDAPIYHKISLNDEFTPLIGAFGCACALFNKIRTGQGQMVETSLLSTAAFLQSGRFIKYKGMKRREAGKPDRMGISATNRLYQGVNGEWFYLYCVTEEHFQAVCRFLGLEKLIADPRFATEGVRKRHDKQLAAILQEALINAPANTQAFLLLLAGVPAAYAQKAGQIFEDAHCKETGVFITIQDPDYGEVLIQDVTTKFSKTPGRIQRPCPLHGQHTTEVLLEIGYTKEQIEEFKAENLVIQSAR